MGVPQAWLFAEELVSGCVPVLTPCGCCALLLFSTDPLCSTGTPGLMLHRALELVHEQI